MEDDSGDGSNIDSVPRRWLLRAGIGGVGATSIAGCAGLIGGSGEGGDGRASPGPDTGSPNAGSTTQTRTDTGTPTRADTETPTRRATTEPLGEGPPEFGRWLPAPAALSVQDYGVRRLGVAALTDPDGPFPESVGEQLRSNLSALPVSGDAVEEYVTVGSGGAGVSVGVFTGSFDPAAVAEAVAAGDEDDLLGGLSERGEHRGYDLYGPGDEVDDPLAAAVSTEALVVATRAADGQTAVEAARTVVDADAGAVDRYAETDGPVATVLDRVGDVTFAAAGSDRNGASPAVERAGRIGSAPEGTTASAVEIGDDGDGVTVEYQFLFETPVDPERRLADLRDRVARVGGARAASLRADGRLVTLAGRVPYAGVSLELLSLEAINFSVPQVAWTFDYDRDGGVVTVTHNGGDSIEAGNTEVLRVRVDGERAATPFDAGDDDPVAAGSTVEVEARPGSTVEVVWRPPGGSEAVVLASYEVPD